MGIHKKSSYFDYYIWHSNTDKIGKFKYMVKHESDIANMIKLKYVVKIVADNYNSQT